MTTPRFVAVTFSGVFVRRLSVLIGVALLALLGVNDAYAVVCGMPTMPERAVSAGSSTVYATRPSAFASCDAAVGEQVVNTSAGNVISNILRCERNGTLDNHRWVLQGTGQRFNSSTCVKEVYADTSTRTGSTGWMWASECPVGQVFNAYANQCQSPCTGRPSTIQSFLPLSGSKQCYNGCVVSYLQNGDDETSTRSYSGEMCGNDQFKEECGAGFFWNGRMGVCQPVEPDCPAGQIREGSQCKPENSCPEGMVSVQGSTPGAIQQGALYCKPEVSECPPGNVRAPSGQCLPGEGQCAAGEARRPNGTCGRDANNDGVADDDDEDPENDSDKEQAFGGDTCAAPPSCNGPAIGCMQIKIQWRIDCNTRRNVNISGGSCNAVPLCTGESCNAMEYSQLMQEWESKCALKKIAEQDGTGESELDDYMSDRDAANKAQADAIAAGGDGHEGVSESSIFGTFDNSSFNPNMFGGGSPGMCSFSTSLELMGNAIELPAGWWNLAAAIGWLVVAAAYVHIAVRLAS
ncbi:MULTISPECIES: hypothetical protein [unclassified Pseudoxanthomonas]|uniref:hypothetical protein n=1 Tax=unclassified Pseudoxanthomonas TaxID=2645906 RepID=UPI00307F40FB